MFLAAGQTLQSKGPTSWRQLEALLSQPNPSAGFPLDFPVGASSLRKRITKLENALEFRLNDRRLGRKGQISEEAVHLLEEVRRYLDAKQTRLNAGG